MGYWGFEPREGDAPLDLFFGVEDAAALALSNLFAWTELGPYDRWARVGTLQEALRRGLAIPTVTVERAIHDIDVVTDDHAFIEEWKDPGRFLDEALRFKELFEQLVKESRKQRGRHTNGRRPRVLVGMGWPDFEIRRGKLYAL